MVLFGGVIVNTHSYSVCGDAVSNTMSIVINSSSRSAMSLSTAGRLSGPPTDVDIHALLLPCKTTEAGVTTSSLASVGTITCYPVVGPVWWTEKLSKTPLTSASVSSAGVASRMERGASAVHVVIAGAVRSTPNSASTGVGHGSLSVTWSLCW